ncbi:D-alanyl-D-alanine carboxypeptidase family protein [Propionicimonas sp.]|uniref:M15 family metallopeptidase n=1 Tax=Propionicimonas sp. TaxID=1955623 RepID=UPI0039E5DB0C
MRVPRTLACAVTAAALGLAGCSAEPPQGVTSAPGPVASTSTPSATPTVTPSATPTPSATTTPTPTVDTPPKDTRKGAQRATPYEVNGIIVVSKKHRITAAYGPEHPTGPYHLEAVAAKALARMTAAAKADGVRIRVHSGYRDWASQNASYQRALKNYPQNISFYAPAGASEHQTGLAVDLWDGVTWSLPMANTATGKWLFAHAHEYGFILRYPNGKAKITGYHYEPWHYRYIGRADAVKFGNNKLTLEEYLGLA